MLIIFLFLRNFRSSIIIGMSIPISIVITLMVMSLMDLTINMMTMSGLILGMGMTVDSSIVILENINKRRGWGENRRLPPFSAAGT
jgi:HAE1 family hydrophobic/amphiphilic exporter-1